MRPTTRRPVTPPPQQAASTPAPEVSKNQWGTITVHKKVIDGVEYTTHLYNAEKGFDLIPFFGVLASGPIGLGLETLGGVMDAGGDLTAARVTSSTVSDAIRNACLDLKELGGAAKVRELLEETHVKYPGLPASATVNEVFDDLFRGRYLHMMKVVAWVVEVNFAPFGQGGLNDLWSRWMEISGRSSNGSSEPPNS